MKASGHLWSCQSAATWKSRRDRQNAISMLASGDRRDKSRRGAGRRTTDSLVCVQLMGELRQLARITTFEVVPTLHGDARYHSPHSGRLHDVLGRVVSVYLTLPVASRMAPFWVVSSFCRSQASRTLLSHALRMLLCLPCETITSTVSDTIVMAGLSRRIRQRFAEAKILGRFECHDIRVLLFFLARQLLPRDQKRIAAASLSGRIQHG